MALIVAAPSALFEDRRRMQRWLCAEDVPSGGEARHAALRQSARGCLRALLFHVTASRDWRFVGGRNGKPHVVDAAGKPGPEISLSHTQGMIACAVSLDGPVGVDVEFRRERDFAGIAGYAFGSDEQRYVSDGGKGAFYRIWTLREAMAKATGEGLRLAASGVDLVGRPPDRDAWSDGDWRLFSHVPDPHHALAAAVRQDERTNGGKIESLAAAEIL